MSASIISVFSIIAVMGLVGLFFGLVLAIANKKLAVELNPQDLNAVCVELNQENNLNLTKDKLKRFLKKS